MTDPVIKTIDVPCSPARAFDVFVRNTARWWPLDRHSVSAGQGQTARDITIEPRVGGAIYETTHDGALVASTFAGPPPQQPERANRDRRLARGRARRFTG